MCIVKVIVYSHDLFHGTHEMGKEIWGVSFLGMSIPRKVFLFYNFRKIK